MPDMDELHVTVDVDTAEFRDAAEDAKRALSRVQYEREALPHLTEVST